MTMQYDARIPLLLIKTMSFVALAVVGISVPDKVVNLILLGFF